MKNKKDFLKRKSELRMVFFYLLDTGVARPFDF